MIRQHEVVDTRCKHCGAVNPTELETCIMRSGPASAMVMPEPARREYAIEDFDAIGARLAELRRERETAMNSAPTMEDLLW